MPCLRPHARLELHLRVAKRVGHPFPCSGLPGLWPPPGSAHPQHHCSSPYPLCHALLPSTLRSVRMTLIGLSSPRQVCTPTSLLSFPHLSSNADQIDPEEIRNLSSRCFPHANSSVRVPLAEKSLLCTSKSRSRTSLLNTMGAFLVLSKPY